MNSVGDQGDIPPTQGWENTSFYLPRVNGFSDGMSESLSSFGKL